MGAGGHGAWLVLEEPGHAALPVASALGGVPVEVPTIQFIDAMFFERPLLCNDSCRFSLGCSTLTVSMHLRDAVAGPLHGALLRNARHDSEYMFCDSSGCVGCIVLFST